MALYKQDHIANDELKKTPGGAGKKTPGGAGTVPGMLKSSQVMLISAVTKQPFYIVVATPYAERLTGCTRSVLYRFT